MRDFTIRGWYWIDFCQSTLFIPCQYYSSMIRKSYFSYLSPAVYNFRDWQQLSNKTFLSSFNSLYVVASKHPNHFKLEKYKPVKYLSHIFFKSPLVQIFTSTSDCKCVRNIPGSHFVKAFAALASQSELSAASQKHRPFNADLMEGTGKNQP